MILDIQNETDYDLNEFLQTLENAASFALEEEGFPADAEISVVIVDSAKIRALNKKYRKTDSETDVLSFPEYDLAPGAYNILPDTNPVYLGDIVISIEKALAQADEYGHSLRRELAFLVAHSVLHLLGYDHEKDGGEIMYEKQERALEKAGVPR